VESNSSNLDNGDDAVLLAERRQAWRNSAELSVAWSRIRWGVAALVLAGAVVGALVGWLFFATAFGTRTEFEDALLGGATGAAIALLVSIYYAQLTWLFQRRAFRDRYTLDKSRALLAEADQGVLDAAADDTSFGALWVATQTRLNYYHEIATSQSQRSFAYGQIAAGTGLLVVLVCTVLAIVADSAAGAVAAGVLGGAAAAMSGYIGSTFLRTQDLAAAQLRDYFGQPLEFSRFLSAERLLSDIKDEARREEATVTLIQAIARHEQRDTSA
jgi:hypothetical protein